jgi:hypothetical protein
LRELQGKEGLIVCGEVVGLGGKGESLLLLPVPIIQFRELFCNSPLRLSKFLQGNIGQLFEAIEGLDSDVWKNIGELTMGSAVEKPPTDEALEERSKLRKRRWLGLSWQSLKPLHPLRPLFVVYQ